MEVLSMKLVVVLERDPATELKAKALLQREGRGPSASPRGNSNSSVPCVICGQSVMRGQGSGDGPFRDAVAEVFARSVEEFNGGGQGNMKDCWRGESCPSCLALMEGVWTLQGKIEGLRGEAKALVERAVGLRGIGGLEGPPEEEAENEGMEHEGRRFFRSRGTRQVQGSTLKKKGDTEGNSNTRPVFAKGSSTPQQNNPPVDQAKTSQNLQKERLDLRPSSESADEDCPVADSPPFTRGGAGPAKKPKVARKRLRSRHSCYFCQKPFASPSHLEEHLTTHTKEKPFPCPHCGKEFARKFHLDRHMRRYVKDKPFKCPHPGCTSSFVTASDLNKHGSSHSGEKPFECNLCGKGFAQKSNLEDHIRRHLKEKWFKCPFKGCTSSFVSGSELKRHTRVHSGERPFKCNLCGKWFSRKETLDRHIRYHLKEKAFKCNLCGKGFVEKVKLDIHIRRHLKEKAFKCSHPGCTSSFVTGCELKVHAKAHFGKKPSLVPFKGVARPSSDAPV